MSASVVIGIHGLKNKPEKNLLTRWWVMSLQEGLQRNFGLASPLAFELVYWADIQYPDANTRSRTRQPVYHGRWARPSAAVQWNRA